MIIPMQEIARLSNKELDAPYPDFSMVGVKITKRIKLKLSDVHIDDAEGNTARYHGTDPQAVESLEKSLSAGWDSTEYLPCIRKLPKGSAYKYELVYGFNRCEAFENLYGEDFEFYFDVIECDDNVLYDVRLIENEGLPKKTNKEIDIKNTIMQKISNGFLSADVDSITDYVDKVCIFRTQQSKDNIVRLVKEAGNINDKFIEYTESKAKRWVKDYSTIKYKFGGEEVNGVHTFLCKQGSAYRTYHRMIRRHIETGKPCQVVFHVGRPTENTNYNNKRVATIRNWNEGIANLKKLGCDTSFMKVAGFLPQVKEKDQWHSLVTNIKVA
tara:strand:+ start:143 stop:1123 length:981 start_codon:yes stop_codon:yes gene_type:complete